MPIFIFIMTAILICAVIFCGFRLISRTSLQGKWKTFVWALICLPLLHIPLRLYIRANSLESAPPLWIDVALFIGYITLGILSTLFTFLLLYDVFLLTKWLWKRCFSKKHVKQEHSSPKNLGRRYFIQNSISAGITVAAAGMVAYGANEALNLPQTKYIQVPIQNLPKSFHGFSIVQLTDLHINKPWPISRMEKIVEQVNALNADTVVITGDLSDSHVKHVQTHTEPLRKLKAKDGKYFVTGNHEYYTNIKQWLEEVARLELINLHNEYRAIERDGQRLLMCGVPDLQAPNFIGEDSDPIAAQKGSRLDDIKILLSHQPQSIYKAVTVGYDLQISGHTHGGQFFPWTYVIDFIQPYVHGLYKVENTHLYVSRGTGYWGPPVRVGAPAEITHITLVPDAKV